MPGTPIELNVIGSIYTGESAYELALRLGFEGTEAEFLASLVGPESPNADAAEAAAVRAETAATTAEGIADLIAEINEQYLTYVDELTDLNAISAGITAEGTTQVGLVNAAGTAITGVGGTIDTREDTAIAAVDAAGTSKVGDVDAAGTTQVAAVNAAGAGQVTTVNAAGTAQIALMTAALGAKFFESTALGLADPAEYFYVMVGTSVVLYRDVAGAAVEQFRWVVPGAVIPCTAGGSANAVTLTLDSGYAVNASAIYMWTVIGQSNGAVTCAIPGVNGGAATPVVLPGTGEALPAAILKTGYIAAVKYKSGTTNFELVLPVHQQQPMIILCTQTGGTGRSPVLTIAQLGIKVPATLDNVIWAYEATLDRDVGSGSVQINNSIGTSVIGVTSFFDRDGTTASPAGRWLAGDMVYARRVGSTFKLLSVSTRFATDAEAVAGTDTNRPTNSANLAAATAGVATKAARPAWALEWQLPSITKPVKMVKVEKNRIIIDVRPQDAAYRDGYTRRYDDIVRYEMMNVASYHGLGATDQIWVLTSMWTRFAGVWVHHINFSFDRIVGATTNTGMVASTFEPVQFCGQSTETLAAINAQGSGPFHGNIAYVGLSLTMDGGANLRDTLATFDVIEGAQLNFSANWLYKCPNGAAGITVSMLHRFAPAVTGHQLMVNSILQYAATPATGVTFGYAAMMPLRLANRVQARDLLGTVSAVATTGLGTGANTSFPNAQRITSWHTDHAGHALEMELGSTYAPFRRNGVQTAYTLSAFLLDNPAGPKVYVPTHDNSTTWDDETGNELSTLAYYNGVRANGA